MTPEQKQMVADLEKGEQGNLADLIAKNRVEDPRVASERKTEQLLELVGQLLQAQKKASQP